MDNNDIANKTIRNLLPANSNAKILDPNNLDIELRDLVQDVKEKRDDVKNYMIVDARNADPKAYQDSIMSGYQDVLNLANTNIIAPQEDNLGVGPMALFTIDPEDKSKLGVDANKSARVYGDPYFQGFEGESYFITGDRGHAYNLISDKNLTVNGRFDRGGAVTYLTEMGFKIGNDEVSYGVNGVPMLNGKPMTAGESDKLPRADVSWDGANLNVNTREYSMMVHTMGGAYLDFQVSTKEKGVFADGVMPTGLVGITADGNNQTRPSSGGYNETGVIQGNYQDYEVANIFADSPKKPHTEA